MNEKIVGADAAAVENAEPVASGVAPHDAPTTTLDEVIASLDHLIHVCSYHTCDLAHFDRVRKFTHALRDGRLLVGTQRHWDDQMHNAMLHGMELQQIADERIEAMRAGNGTQPLSEASGSVPSAAP